MPVPTCADLSTPLRLAIIGEGAGREWIGDMTAWLTALTDFGDLALLIPLSAAILIWLVRNSSRAAPRWIFALSLCIGLTALLKIAFHACPAAYNIYSPSGHTSLSTLVYGALTLVSATAWPGLHRVLVIAGGAGLILAIGVSRLLLDAHSVAEVGLGLVIGAVSLAMFSRQYLQAPTTKRWPLLLAAGALALVLHGHELHAEQFLHRITGYIPVHCG
jgi:membrane-associated phospholipid phosphatase